MTENKAETPLHLTTWERAVILTRPIVEEPMRETLADNWWDDTIARIGQIQKDDRTRQ